MLDVGLGGSRFFLFLLTLSFLVTRIPGFSQAPPGYYDPATGLTGEALQQALHDIIDDHTVLTYSSLYFHFQSTDAKPGDVVWDMYSDVPGGTPPYLYHYNLGDECGNYSGEGDCYNREHSWPNSWFGGTVYPMYTDLFHLYPTDGYVNNRRANYPYGTVGAASWTSLNGSKVGSCSFPGFSGTVFEPIDEYKGDFARSYFYMAVRYYGEDSGWPGSPMTSGSQLLPWAISLLQQWNADDPVSGKETDRNNAVYLVQQNRNPFIDHPEFVYDLWGYPVGISEPHHGITLKVAPNPMQDQCRIGILASSGMELSHTGLPAATPEGGESIQVFDSFGKQIPVKVASHAGELVLDLSGFPPGLYLLLLTSESGSGMARIQKD